MLKVKAQLTNARPAKDATPMLSTTPTTGNMKLSESAAAAIGVSNGDYLAVVVAETDEGNAFYLFKGHEGGDGQANVGSKLGTTNGKMGGALEFSSANTWKQLGGNADTKIVFEVDTDGVESDGVEYFKLSPLREEAKIKRGASVADYDEVDA